MLLVCKEKLTFGVVLCFVILGSFRGFWFLSAVGFYLTFIYTHTHEQLLALAQEGLPSAQTGERTAHVQATNL